MALFALLRGAASRGSVCQLHAVSNPARFIAGSSNFTRGSSLFSTLTQPHVRQTVSSKLLGLQSLKNVKVQTFFTSPKRLNAAGHNHSKLWTVERAFSAALLLVVPAALVSPNQLLDTIAAVTLVMHSHWGIEALVVDYVRPILFGNTAPKIALGGVYLLSIVTLAGLLHLIYNDIGLANTVKKVWSL